MRRTEQYSLRLRPDQIERLRELSRATRVPASVIVRDALDDALDRWEAERWKRTQEARHEADVLRGEVTRRWVADEEE